MSYIQKNAFLRITLFGKMLYNCICFYPCVCRECSLHNPACKLRRGPSPHMRGALFCFTVFALVIDSSPRMQGAQKTVVFFCLFLGFIPAYVGSTLIKRQIFVILDHCPQREISTSSAAKSVWCALHMIFFADNTFWSIMFSVNVWIERFIPAYAGDCDVVMVKRNFSMP